MDPFTANILGVQNLIDTNTNKIPSGGTFEEGVESELVDDLDLLLDDTALLDLKRQWENKTAPYTAKVEARQKVNKAYLWGVQRSGNQGNRVVPSNMLFQATATFVPQALAKNPEPVVWSDNTEEGIKESNDIKTMLQFHADVLCLRKKLSAMVWHWSVYFTAVVKHGWNEKANDISTELRNPANFLLDPDGFVDEYGDYQGAFLGEHIQSSASELIDLFPDHKELILKKVNGKEGTLVRRTEWWTDEYCFTTFEDVILDKHKNEFFSYKKGSVNHFAHPKMPYTFLSVFSLQEQPHDFTNLIEQNIANQDSVNDRDAQISKNLAHGNNSIVVSATQFNVENAHQAADALEKGDPILVEGNIDAAIKRIPANALPDGILPAQENAKQTLLGVYGTLGVTAQQPTENTTARGMILNQSYDNTRIGGGVGDALEQVADNIFNWWLQLYYVFYDEQHYAAIMGSGRAVEYVGLNMANVTRQFVVSVAPNSMKPKDEISEMNNALELANAGWLDPINLFKKLNYPDPMETAKAVTMFKLSPELYFKTYFPDVPLPQEQSQGQGGGQIPPESNSPPTTLSQEPASAQLSQVPLPT